MSSPGASNRSLAVLLLAVSACANAQAPPSDVTSLFDGTLGQATIENGGAFTIEGGTLRSEGPEGWLRFPGLVRDFRLRVELRFLTDNADSGVFFRALPFTGPASGSCSRWKSWAPSS
jgi:hypothetical protein